MTGRDKLKYRKLMNTSEYRKLDCTNFNKRDFLGSITVSGQQRYKGILLNEGS